MFHSIVPLARLEWPAALRSTLSPHAGRGKKRLLAILVAVAVALLFQHSQALAQAHEFLGDWQQLSSNAGACPRCQISFSGGSSQLNVAANNGWSATIDTHETAAGPTASGRGSWRAGVGTLASKSFSVDFTLRGERLYMTMINDLGNGRKQIVRAVFGRPWLGA